MRTAKKKRKKMHSAKVQQGQSLSVRKQAIAGITAAEALRAIRDDTRESPPGAAALMGHIEPTGRVQRCSEPSSLLPMRMMKLMKTTKGVRVTTKGASECFVQSIGNEDEDDDG